VYAGLRKAARRAEDLVSPIGRRLGVLPYRTEHWNPERWSQRYTDGSFEYFGALPERGRYSSIAGYVGYLAEEAKRPLRLLDVGCGEGTLRRRLRESDVRDFVGIDLSADAVAEANAQHFANSRFSCADVLGFDEDGFDVAILNEVLYTVANPEAVLSRVASRLEVDGHLVISMWRHPGERSLWATVDGSFEVFDRVEVRNRANEVNPKGWIVACGRRRP
jgi:2-polyprenyl-3-methyl-5-hydroxy-6-metoxy-1,4-benzoquinol methylase